MILDRHECADYCARQAPRVRPRAAMLALGLLIAFIALSVGLLVLLTMP